MDSLIQFIRNPFSFNYDFDRYRRNHYNFYGYYQPTKLKRCMMWLMNESVEPINWEEVPPYVEPEIDQSLKHPREGHTRIYECCTQPNMLTQNDIYLRRALLAGVFYKIYSHLEKKIFIYNKVYMMKDFYYSRFGFKIIILSWLYYMICRIYVNKDYQLPYN